MDFVKELSYLYPELAIMLGALAALMIGCFSSDSSTPLINRMSILLFIVSIIFVTIIPSKTEVYLLRDMFVVDGFSSALKILILISAIVVMMIISPAIEDKQTMRFEFGVLYMIAVCGMMLMVSANNLLSLYVSLEMQSLSLYVLASFNRGNLQSSEAGVKYFVLGALASGILLFGVSIVYGFAGTTDFTQIMAQVSTLQISNESTLGIMFGVVLVVVGLLFKVSAAPFHMWTPDVYQGAPTAVTTFFAALPKLAALGLLARVLVQPFGDLHQGWEDILIIVAVLSMLVGAFGAISQSNFKRLLAYSSIGHVGYILLGIIIGSEEGIKGLMVYMVTYLPATLAAFACLLMLRRNSVALEEINDFSGLAKVNPRISFILLLSMFSMAGIPPLAGFFGKFYIFRAAVEEGMIILAVIGVLASVVSAFYYLRIVKVMYFEESKFSALDVESSFMRKAAVVFCAAMLFCFIVPAVANEIVEFSEKAAIALMS
jgi:NADH-quinone oxidoreductase subunit N